MSERVTVPVNVYPQAWKAFLMFAWQKLGYLRPLNPVELLQMYNDWARLEEYQKVYYMNTALSCGCVDAHVRYLEHVNYTHLLQMVVDRLATEYIPSIMVVSAPESDNSVEVVLEDEEIEESDVLVVP